MVFGFDMMETNHSSKAAELVPISRRVKVAETWTVRHSEVVVYPAEEAGLDYMSVIMAETADKSGKVIEFQLALDEYEQLDGYCIVDARPSNSFSQNPMELAAEVAEHRTVYGGVERCQLRNGTLTFVFRSEVLSVFGWERELSLVLDIDDDMREELIEGLSKVLSVPPEGEETPAIDFGGR